MDICTITTSLTIHCNFAGCPLSMCRTINCNMGGVWQRKKVLLISFTKGSVRVHDKTKYEERYAKYIRKTGLLPSTTIVSCSTPKMCPCAIMTLIDRCRLEKHSFHFHCGEMIVTLQDASMILAIPIKGDPICFSIDYGMAWHYSETHREGLSGAREVPWCNLSLDYWELLGVPDWCCWRYGVAVCPGILVVYNQSGYFFRWYWRERFLYVAYVVFWVGAWTQLGYRHTSLFIPPGN